MERNVPRLASKPVHAQQPYILSPCLQIRTAKKKLSVVFKLAVSLRTNREMIASYSLPQYDALCITVLRRLTNF